jgi:hypothetical protein
MQFLQFGSGGGHLFLQLHNAVLGGSLTSDEVSLHMLQAASHLSYKMVVGLDQGDRIACGSVILRGGFAGMRRLLGSGGGLGSMIGSQTTDQHSQAKCLQRYDGRRVSAQLRQERWSIVSFARSGDRFCLGFEMLTGW